MGESKLPCESKLFCEMIRKVCAFVVIAWRNHRFAESIRALSRHCESNHRFAEAIHKNFKFLKTILIF